LTLCVETPEGRRDAEHWEKITQRAQQYRIHDTENRGVRTDSKRKWMTAIIVNPGFFNSIRAP
jgi:hypothetical protein